MESAVWGFIGTIVGALASIGTTIVSGRNAASMQASASSLERAERHRSFQRNTLIELQDALHDLMRLVAKGHYEDEMAYRETGNWAATRLSEEVNEGQRLAHRHLLILVERVADEALRAELKQLSVSLGEVSLARSQTSANTSLEKALHQGTQVLEHVGEVLRSQY